ncbi:phosphatase PAP2 family protein [Gordonia aichiensis]|uniref:phosphatase PAP2 family protein n=1 Tax=Gordonia aichiensis TaxID=36820 RepID=UPI003D769CF4
MSVREVPIRGSGEPDEALAVDDSPVEDRTVGEPPADEARADEPRADEPRADEPPAASTADVPTVAGPTESAPAPPSAPIVVVEEKARDYRLLRRSLLAVWAVSVGLFFWREGIAADRTSLIVILAFGMAAATVGRRRMSALFIDWLPFVLILMLYDWTRDVALWLDMPTHWLLAPDVDRWMFGTNLTVWLQAHLKEASPPWWEVVVSVVYMSYFIVPYATAAVLWVRDRQVWRRFAACFIAVSFLGLVGYSLVPAAPPWAAARCTASQVADNPHDPPCMYYRGGAVPDNILGEVQPQHDGANPYVERISDRGWRVVGLDLVMRAINIGQAKSNLVAAIPSLHAGLTMILALFMWPRTRWLGRTMFMGYAWAMAFALVYTAEHYVFDILLGWGLAGAVYTAYRVVDARLIAPRHARREAERERAVDSTIDEIHAAETARTRAVP